MNLVPIKSRAEMDEGSGSQSRYGVPTREEAEAQMEAWYGEAAEVDEHLLCMMEQELIYTTGSKKTKPAGTWRVWCWYFEKRKPDVTIQVAKDRWAQISAKRGSKHHCMRCNNWWDGRQNFKGDRGLPKRCPGCRSPLWNTPRRNRAGQGRPPAAVAHLYHPASSCS